MSLSAVLNKTDSARPSLVAARVTSPLIATEGISVSASSGFAKADPAVGRGLQLGKDWYPDGLGGFLPTPQTVPPTPRPAQYGGDVWPTWTQGQSTVYTQAADPACVPIITRANGVGAFAMGVLSSLSSSRGASNFEVLSLNPANGQLVDPDVGTFDFVLLSPSWA